MHGRRLGPYRLVAELGAGGMGKVWKAEVVGRAPGLPEGSVVAVKLVHPHLLETPGFFKRFLREAEIGKAVVHENVVRTFDADEVVVDGRVHHFLVMEYVEGQTLRGLLAELGRVPEELCRHVGREIAKGLAAIHAAGVVHRDLKPENIIVARCPAEGDVRVPDRYAVKVMDLGVARLADERFRISQSGAFVGSLQYAAPEQFKEPASVDARADLHALGIVLYELATGLHPYHGDDFKDTLHKLLEASPRRCAELNPQLTPFFEEVVHTLLAKRREERIATALELVRILDDGEKSEWWRARAKAIRAATKSPLRRIRVPRDTDLYGREAELAKLTTLYERAKAGEGVVVLVEGEAGIGKSRLVDEFVSRLRSAGEDLNFLFGGYPPAGAATASGAFNVAYREQFGDEGLTEVLGAYLPQTPLLVPAFAALLRGDATPTGAEPLTKETLQTVFVHATRSLAAERPTIVTIDDLQFAPDEGRALFAALALAVPRHRILLVGTTRPGLDAKWLAHIDRIGVERIALARLGPKDVAKLLIDALRSERTAEELALKVLMKSDGNPYFVFEILRGLREGRYLTKTPEGAWVTTRVVADIQIPSSVLDLVNARVAELDEDERNLLDVAACCGFEFDPLLVAGAMGIGAVPAMQRFARIEKKHRLVRSAGRRLVFDHHQVQEALYGALLVPLREAYHAAIAQALETRHRVDEADARALDGAVCLELTEHHFAAAQDAKALRRLGAALTHLEKSSLHDAAVRLADRALASTALAGRDRCELLLRKGARLELLGRPDEQAACLEEARSLADAAGEPSPRVRARIALGGHLSLSSRPDEARRVLDEAVSLASETGDRRSEASARRVLGRVFWTLGRYDESLAQVERALALSREIGDPEGEAWATGNLGVVLKNLGRYEEALSHYRRHLELGRAIGSRALQATAMGNLGLVLHDLGRYDEARATMESHLALTREIGDRYGEAIATGNLGLVHHSCGRLEEARAHYGRHLALTREIGYRQGEAIASGNLGNVLEDLGLYDEARSSQERRLAISREIGFRSGEGYALADLGSLRVALGDFAGARHDLDAALALGRKIGAKPIEACALHGLGELADEAGDTDQARRLLSEALSLRRGIGAPDGVARTLCDRGAVLARSGAVDEARRDLEEALDLALRMRHAELEVLARARLAGLAGGDAVAALAAILAHERRLGASHAMEVRFLLARTTGDAAHLAEAKRLLDHLVAHAPESSRGPMLANVRLHAAIAAGA